MSTNTGSTSNFQPAFQRVEQSHDYDCAFACIAMIAGKTVNEVRQIAFEKFKHKHGPYWVGEHLIQVLLAHYGWVASVYKESNGIASLPDTAIGMVEYDPETEVGRHVLFHRMRDAKNPKQVTEYVIDPAYWVAPEKFIRTDIKGFPISWYIEVHPMNPPGGKVEK